MKADTQHGADLFDLYEPHPSVCTAQPHTGLCRTLT